MWTYKQSTGELFHPSGILAGRGWSGQGEHKNNPLSQHVKGKGPLPLGPWKVVKPAYRSARLGPVVMKLVPMKGTETFGRDLFRIHGATADDPGTPVNETEFSSEGCLIFPRFIRDALNSSNDDILNVIL